MVWLGEGGYISKEILELIRIDIFHYYAEVQWEKVLNYKINENILKKLLELNPKLPKRRIKRWQ